jgi:glycerol-1-phosphatase
MTRSEPLVAGAVVPPSEVYDVALLDLDGVVYVGPDAVPGVPEALATAR